MSVDRPRSVNGLAVAGFVLSLLWLGGLGAVLAVIFTAIALRQVRARNQSGQGLAIAGLVIGIVGIVGAGILWATFFVGQNVNDKFRDTCTSISVTGNCQ